MKKLLPDWATVCLYLSTENGEEKLKKKNVDFLSYILRLLLYPHYTAQGGPSVRHHWLIDQKSWRLQLKYRLPPPKMAHSLNNLSKSFLEHPLIWFQNDVSNDSIIFCLKSIKLVWNLFVFLSPPISRFCYHQLMKLVVLSPTIICHYRDKTE